MSLSEAGELCGTPEQLGAFPMLVTVEDQLGVVDSSLFIFRVRGSEELTAITRSLEDARLGEAYGAELTAQLGAPPYEWRLVSGALPAGLSLEMDGRILGTPTALGQSVFVVQLSDQARGARLVPLSIRVLEAGEGSGGGDGCRCVSSPRPSGAWLTFGLLLCLGWGRLRPSRRAR